MRSIKILAAAADEAVAVAEWYENERLGLGHEFFAEIFVTGKSPATHR